jgi:hypothetical protein
MNGSQPWIDAWKTRAENRRQLLEQALSRKPVNPALASIRDLYLKRVQAIAKNRLNLAEAYLTHTRALTRIVDKGSGRAASSGSKGSLGEAG